MTSCAVNKIHTKGPKSPVSKQQAAIKPWCLQESEGLHRYYLFTGVEYAQSVPSLMHRGTIELFAHSHIIRASLEGCFWLEPTLGPQRIMCRLCPHLLEMRTSQGCELTWESLRLLAWIGHGEPHHKKRDESDKGQTGSQSGPVMEREADGQCACETERGWPRKVEKEEKETPLQSSAVTPAGRFTPSTKWLVNREGSKQAFHPELLTTGTQQCT